MKVTNLTHMSIFLALFRGFSLKLCNNFSESELLGLKL